MRDCPNCGGPCKHVPPESDEEALIETMDICELEKENDSLRAKMDEAKKLITDHLWICDCRCDVAYTSRHMHEPNAVCGEMDDMKEWLATQVGS